MAKIENLRTGQRIRVESEGQTVIGTFGGILPGQPGARGWRAQEDKIVLRSGDVVTYLPTRCAKVTLQRKP